MSILYCNNKFKFSGIAILVSQRVGIDFKGFFLKLVRKFVKIADF